MADKPDYQGLIHHLMKPFLDTPEDLKMDIEQIGDGRRVLLRVAFSTDDRGRMFGRGGRNIQAIRTVLETTAALYDQKVSLDVYGESNHESRSGSDNGSGGDRNRRPRRGGRPSPRRN
ncbi:KH domain-containing protein [Oscillatoria sp. CS-180]|uniref:KH domain-containing protein n=1 Tax=Oscillatoria sp. CS-180 TaxID=3021720 RepID=UPI00232BB203|nr:KH domain-containing protein [Oscillatoria sp. CS-180]MDB9525558.1 KH domain-containing protein [Oscillatoria sp. CS-180]